MKPSAPSLPQCRILFPKRLSKVEPIHLPFDLTGGIENLRCERYLVEKVSATRSENQLLHLVLKRGFWTLHDSISN